jgi:hypothetical protein
LEPCASQVVRVGRIAANARRGKCATPIALEDVKPIDALFDVEREINGLSVEMRLAARQERSAALVAALEDWMRAERGRYAAMLEELEKSGETQMSPTDLDSRAMGRPYQVRCRLRRASGSRRQASSAGPMSTNLVGHRLLYDQLVRLALPK